jgi:hypothetical protein
MRPYLRNVAHAVYRIGRPISDLRGTFYEVGVAQVLDWGVWEGWADGGWVRLKGMGTVSLAAIISISDHNIPTEHFNYKSRPLRLSE